MDIYELRKDFPLFRNGGKGIIYFDNACMTLKPQCVIDKLVEFYSEYPACAGRSLHKLSARVTDEYERSREIISDFIGAGNDNYVVFTKNSTESINLIANSFPFEKGDVVLGTDHEHNSNIVPWLKARDRITYKVLPSRPDNTCNIEKFKEMVKGVKLVSMVHVSNLDGSRIPEKEIIEIAHDEGAYVALDCAQSVPHMKIDMKKLDLDLLVFSGHKACGPTGTGVLAGKEDLVDLFDPFMVGGDTVEETFYDDVKFLPPPKKFEAGLQHYGGFIGLGEAIGYLDSVGPDEIHDHEISLNRYATDLIADKLDMIGPAEPENRGGIFPFRVPGLNSHDVSMMMDELANICLRSGRHCVHSWFNDRKEESTARASFYLYNTKEEVRIFAETMETIIEDFT
jgi:cysteine desulfurase/selenocysteine lyase